MAQPLQEKVPLYAELTGNLRSVAEVKLEARVQGFLEQIKYVDGATVKKGDLLFVIQQNTYQAQLAQAKAALQSNQATQQNAQVEFTRQQTLAQQQFASQSRLDDARTKLAEANANVLSAQANLDIANINLGYTEVTAPFDGVASRHLISIGALVGYSGPTELASVVQIDPIWVYFQVSELVVQRVKDQLDKQGKTLRDVHDVPVEIGLQTEQGYPHKGVIDYIAPQLDPSTGTLEVRGVFENKDYALLPGMFARVRIPIERPGSVLMVPDIAIGTSQTGRYVLVINKDNVVEQRTVTIGQLDNQMRVIEFGPQAGGLGRHRWHPAGHPGRQGRPRQTENGSRRGRIDLYVWQACCTHATTDIGLQHVTATACSRVSSLSGQFFPTCWRWSLC